MGLSSTGKRPASAWYSAREPSRERNSRTGWPGETVSNKRLGKPPGGVHLRAQVGHNSVPPQGLSGGRADNRKPAGSQGAQIHPRPIQGPEEALHPILAGEHHPVWPR